MKKHKKYAIVAIILGAALALVPYIVVYSQSEGKLWETPNISNTGSIYIPHFSDDFDSPILNSTWQFIDYLGNSSLYVTTRPGWLKMTTTSPPLRDMISGPRLVQSGITGDFKASTRVQADINYSDGGSAGIIIWEDNQHYLILHRTHSAITDQILFGPENGRYINFTIGFTVNPTTLSLEKHGNDFTADVDGKIIGTVSLTMEGPVDVGLSMSLSQEGNFSVFFDYFQE